MIFIFRSFLYIIWSRQQSFQGEWCYMSMIFWSATLDLLWRKQTKREGKLIFTKPNMQPRDSQILSEYRWLLKLLHCSLYNYKSCHNDLLRRIKYWICMMTILKSLLEVLISILQSSLFHRVTEMYCKG